MATTATAAAFASHTRVLSTNLPIGCRDTNSSVGTLWIILLCYAKSSAGLRFDRVGDIRWQVLRKIAVWIAVGIGVGVAIGTALHSMTLSICIGVVAGAAIGTAVGRR
jgi:hypothetical protein